MNLDPATRRANRWLMFALAIFAVGFCALILLWMRHVTLRNGGKVYPPEKVSFSAGQNHHSFSRKYIL